MSTGQTDDDPAALARLGMIVADDLEHRGYPPAGIIRQLARLAAQIPASSVDACPTCGGEVTQPATGRRRVYCSPRCRYAKRARNAKVTA